MSQHDPRGTGAVIDNIMKWSRRPEWSGLFDEVVGEHVGDALDEFGLASLDDLGKEIGPDFLMSSVVAPSFEDFLARDNDAGETIIDEYLRRRSFKESVPGRRYLEALRDSLIGLYEVLEAVPRSHLVLRDRLRGGEPVRVEERSGSRQLVRWDNIGARVIPFRRELVLSGIILPFEPETADRLELVLREAAREIGEEVERRLGEETGPTAATPGSDDEDPRTPPGGEESVADARGATAPADENEPPPHDAAAVERFVNEKFAALAMDLALFQAAPIFTQAWLTQTLNRLRAPAPRLVNTEGEAIVVTQLRWRILCDAAEVERRLDASGRDDIERYAPAEPRWNWEGTQDLGMPRAGRPDSEAPEDTLTLESGKVREGPDKVSLGTIEIEGHELVLHVNSEGRAERGRTMLESMLAGRIGEPTASRQAAGELRRQAGDGPPPAGGPEGPTPEFKSQVLGELLDRHYHTWPDHPVPALDAKTPREAARTEAGRVALMRLLKLMENREARRARDAGTPPYEFGWLWRELGLGPVEG